jgi:peptidoglycan/LPS O-acetylase OafA/YrhL
MDVGLSLMLPGLLGGLIIAALLAWLNRRPSAPGVVKRSALEPLSPDTINMAHIRVAGIGGLGLVAACIIIAMYLPELRYALSISLALGAALAAILIVARAKAGRTASDDRGPHASAMLPLDAPSSAPHERIEVRTPGRLRAVARA